MKYPKNPAIKKQRKNGNISDLSQHIFDFAQDGILIHELLSSKEKGRFINVNKSACKMFGYSKEEFLKLRVFDLLTKEAKKEIPDLIKRIQKNKKGMFEINLIKKNKKHIPVEINTNIINYRKRPIALSVARDIRKHKVLEEKLNKNIEELNSAKKQIETILKNIEDAVVVTDQNYRCIYSNTAKSRSAGSSSNINNISWKQHQKEFKSFYNVLDEQGNPFSSNLAPIIKAYKGETNPRAIVQLIDKKRGRRKWVMIRSHPLFDKKGSVVMVITVYTDITKKREVEFYKDEFINLASHEFKTPLTSLKIYSQIMQADLSKKRYDNLPKVAGEINNLIVILESYVNDFLDMNKIEAGKMPLTVEKQEICALINEVCQNLHHVFPKYKLIVKCEKQKVALDKARIRQVLTNLITNAIKYSPRADRVNIKAVEKGNEMIISVQDYGIGIPKNEQKNIFERFGQVKIAQRSKYGGLGLGLFISKDIVERHQGKIWLKSKPGKGSTFYFSLPVSPERK